MNLQPSRAADEQIRAKLKHQTLLEEYLQLQKVSFLFFFICGIFAYYIENLGFSILYLLYVIAIVLILIY